MCKIVGVDVDTLREHLTPIVQRIVDIRLG